MELQKNGLKVARKCKQVSGKMVQGNATLDNGMIVLNLSLKGNIFLGKNMRFGLNIFQMVRYQIK